MIAFLLAEKQGLIAAAVLKFDDSEKQAKYEAISFDEIREEINKLKVFFLFAYVVSIYLLVAISYLIWMFNVWCFNIGYHYNDESPDLHFVVAFFGRIS